MTKHTELFPDPFQEQSTALAHRDLFVLGAAVRFESNSARLLQLVDLAYARLPRLQLSARQQSLRIRLLLTAAEGKRSRSEPASLQMFSGAGLLAGTTGSS